MAPIPFFGIIREEGINYYVDVSSNSLILGFTFHLENAQIQFSVEDKTMVDRFSRVNILKDMLNANENEWIILVDDTSVTATITDDIDNTYIYIQYNPSSKIVAIIGTEVNPAFTYKSEPFLTTLIVSSVIVMATIVGVSLLVRLKKYRRDMVNK